MEKLKIMKPKVLAIMGPTASGKSKLSLELAQAFNGEIISADSAQLYIGADIGTAKPTAEELAQVAHHLVNIRTLSEPQFSLAEFKQLAGAAIEDIHKRGRLPIVSGGTGLYLRGLLDGYTLIDLPPDPELRESLNQRSLASLLAQLVQLDPDTYAKIDRCNKRRVSRALEVVLQTGRSFSQVSRREPPNFDILKLGINIERTTLYERIDRRCQVMLDSGWAQEVEWLKEQGHEADLRRLHILGYPELLDALDGTLSLEEAGQKIRFATHRYAKRQQTWLKAETDLHKIEFGANLFSEAETLVKAWLAGQSKG